MPIKKPLDIEEYHKVASKECFICNIVRHGDKREKHAIIYEDTSVIVFLNNYPTCEAQVLVCPKQHLTQVLEDLSPYEYQHLMTVVRKVGLAIKKITNAARIYFASLGSNELNSHIHLHVLPITSDLPYEHQQLAAFDHKDGVYVYSDQEKKDLAEAIFQEMSKYKY